MRLVARVGVGREGGRGGQGLGVLVIAPSDGGRVGAALGAKPGLGYDPVAFAPLNRLAVALEPASGGRRIRIYGSVHFSI